MNNKFCIQILESLRQIHITKQCIFDGKDYKEYDEIQAKIAEEKEQGETEGSKIIQIIFTEANK